MGFNKPSKIQETALPLLLTNGPDGKPNNMIAQSQSGTGKTAAFALTMLSRVDPNLKTPQAICLTNSRELAQQVTNEISRMAKFTDIKAFAAVGGSGNFPPLPPPLPVFIPGSPLILFSGLAR